MDNLKNFFGSNFSVQNCMKSMYGMLQQPKTEVSKDVDQKKLENTKNFFLKNERTILFTASIGAQFFMSPRILIVGAIAGAYLKIKYFDHPYMKELDPQNEILSVFETALAVLGAVGMLARQMYPRTILELSPLLTGVSLGSVLFDIYIRTSEKLFFQEKSNSD